MSTDPHYWLHWAEIGWAAFLLYWFFSAWRLKAVKKREPNSERLIYLVCMASVYVLMFKERLSFGWLGRRFIPQEAALAETGVAITVTGIALAIWARAHLGQNWSATVTVKEGHELIRSGPYGRIRHPIYTGMLLALVGTAVALGEYRGLISLGIATASFFVKARKEERYLRAEFGPGFDEHIEKTGMFLPKLT